MTEAMKSVIIMMESAGIKEMMRSVNSTTSVHNIAMTEAMKSVTAMMESAGIKDSIELVKKVVIPINEPATLKIQVNQPNVYTNLDEEHESGLDYVINTIVASYPWLTVVRDGLRAKKFSEVVIAIVIIFLLDSMRTYLINLAFVDNDKYQINRNYAPVKTSPESGMKNIINRLDKDTFVEKIDEEGVYIKIKYINKDGESKEVWIDRIYITEWTDD